MEKTTEGHVVVWGYGRAGKAVARALKSLGIRFLVAGHQAGRESLTDEGPAVNWDPAWEKILVQAGIRHAEILISTADSDEQNVSVCRAARRLNPGIRIVARARVPESIPKIRKAGADEVLCLEIEEGRSLAQAALEGDEH